MSRVVATTLPIATANNGTIRNQPYKTVNTLAMRKQLQKLADTTTAHGPGYAAESGSWTGTAYWTAITIVAFSFVMYQSEGLFNQYRSGSIHSSLMPVDVLKEGTEHVKITYCSDDWVDLDKLNKSSLSVSDFVYFMTLIPGMIPRGKITGQSQRIPYDVINVLFDSEPIHTALYMHDSSGNKAVNDNINTALSFRAGYLAGLEDEIEAAARNLRQFAIEHKITNMLDFARYFARQNVAIGNTREIGQTLAFGRYCRQLEVVEDQTVACSAKRQTSTSVGFQVKYDMHVEIAAKMNYWVNFQEFVAVLPMTGLDIVSDQLQNQIRDAAFPRGALELHNVKEELDSGILSNITEVTEFQTFTAMPMVISFALDSKIQHRPNAGKSPCKRNENDNDKRPTLYNKWICREKCFAKVIQQRLSEDSRCDFVGSHAESLDVEQPCSCERYIPMQEKVDAKNFGREAIYKPYPRGYVGDQSVSKCQILKDLFGRPDPTRSFDLDKYIEVSDGTCNDTAKEYVTCLKACDSDDILPDCITYDNRLSLVSGAKFFGGNRRSSFEYKYGKYNMSDFATGEMLLHIDVNVRSMIRITEYLATDLTDFIVGLGGIAGFFLGFSIMTVLHCVTVLVKSPYDLIKARKIADK